MVRERSARHGLSCRASRLYLCGKCEEPKFREHLVYSLRYVYFTFHSRFPRATRRLTQTRCLDSSVRTTARPHIDNFDVEVSFAPDDIPNLCRMTTCRMETPQSSLTRLLAYQDADTDLAGVMGLVEESVLRGLAPRHAPGPDPLGEPSATLG